MDRVRYARPDDGKSTVNTMWQAGLTGALALVVLTMGAGPRAQSVDLSTVPSAVASNGAVVAMPGINGLDCDGMLLVLRQIDNSNYRGTDPVPEGHPDWPIFEYEDRLTGKYYYSCTVGKNQLEDPGAAFSFGFESQ